MSEQNPEVFALSPVHFQRLRRTLLWTAVIVIPVSMALSALSGRRNSTGWMPTIVVYALVIAIVAIVMRFSYKKQEARWQTFRITLSNDQVARTQEGYDDVRLGASSISRAVRIRGRGLLIYAASAQPAIIIPETLERFDDCCALLERFRPIEVRSRSLLPRWLAIPAALAMLVVYSLFQQSADLRVVVGLGLLIAGAAAIGVWRLYGSPDIEKRMKKRLVWVPLLFVLPVGIRMWSALTAPRRMEEAIRDNHLLSLLVKARPELHDRLRDALIVAEKNKSDARGGSYVHPGTSLFAEVLPDYLPICSDGAIITYAKELLAVLEKLEADPSEICHDWLMPRGVTVPLLGVLGQDGLNPLTDAMTAVVESALTSPQPAPDAGTAESLRARAMERLTTDPSLGPLELRSPETPGFDRKRWCHTAASTFKVMLDLPEKESSLVLRHVLSPAAKR